VLVIIFAPCEGDLMNGFTARLRRSWRYVLRVYQRHRMAQKLVVMFVVIHLILGLLATFTDVSLLDFTELMNTVEPTECYTEMPYTLGSLVKSAYLGLTPAMC
jgi:hypothetical protein